MDGGLSPQEAIDAPRLHREEGRLYAEPGVDVAALQAAGHTVSVFDAPNLYFGGCQAVGRDPGSGAVSGGADHRRGGALASA